IFDCDWSSDVCSSDLSEASFIDRIPIYPSLQIGIIKPVQVIIHPADDVNLFARKPIDVVIGQRAAFGEHVTERVVAVAGGAGLRSEERRVGKGGGAGL